MQAFAGNAAIVTVACPAGKIAFGGGGSSSNRTVTKAYPVKSASNGTTAGTLPSNGDQANGWTVEFSGANASNTAYVTCSP